MQYPNDELRVREQSTVIITYEEYFEPMVLTKWQRKKRIALAEELEDALFLLFLAWYYETDIIEAQKEFTDKYIAAVEKYDDVNLRDDFDEYITLLAAALYESTLRNIDDPYFTSLDRAVYVAANEANTALNKIEFGEAKADGKTMKTWHTEQDLRVRDTHVPLDNKTIPIDGLFMVGGYPMAIPKDETHGAPLREIANCRCSVTYS